MRQFFLLMIVVMISCKQSEPEAAKAPLIKRQKEKAVSMDETLPKNAAFRNVLIGRSGDSIEISGQARVFEASFSWVIEDGHDQLAAGHQTTSAGAPEWGNFQFRILAPELEPQTVPHIILFEPSAKDGSRQHELPLRIPD